MCGIVGVLNKSGKEVSRDLLKKMADTLVHRGPDDEGYYINPSRNFGLGFRRLSIIDLKTGHQPISNETQAIWVVLNGEIYNFLELREGLKKKGHTFATNSDTEVLVHLYEEEGIGCLERLRGMFAFCLWDDQEKLMLLARDRVGKKPLCYTFAGGNMIFASEIKALLEHPDVSSQVDLKAMDHYLTYGYSTPGNSIFAGIKKLPPAHFLIADKNGIRIERYWSLDYQNKLKLKDGEYCGLIVDSLREAVKLRMISDVPLGALLSGGVDSSCVVALMSRMSERKIKTFSIGFEEEDYSELKYAKAVASVFGTDHHEFIVRPDIMEILPKLIWHYNEPFGDSSCIPTYYVSKVARQHVTVVLNGDGGDESFAGYERYIGLKFAELITSAPREGVVLLRLLLKAAARLGRCRETSRLSKACTYLGVLTDYDSKYVYPRLISIFTPQEKDMLYTQDFKKNNPFGYSFDFLADIMSRLGSLDVVDKAMATDILSYLPEDLLVKMDIATMSNSLEGRSPFLDHKMMELAARIPAGLKLKGFTTKYILKKAFSGVLPVKILNRKKMGFGVPIGRWFRTDLRGFISSILLSEEFLARGFFNKGFVKRMLDDHISGRANYTHKIWNLLNLELWYRIYISKSWQGSKNGA